MKVIKRGLPPITILPIGFLCIIVLGTVLFMLPVSTADSKGLPFIDALFTSTSSVCVTGLSVIEAGRCLTLFGQIVMIVLIQCGGLGFMSITSFMFMLMRKRFSLHDRMNMAESMAQDRLQGVVKMSIYVLVLTFAIEIAGALLLSIQFIPEYGVGHGLWYSIFHSISAFCNAGFDILGEGVSFAPYMNNPLVSVTLMLLIVLGGIGFAVIVDIFDFKTRKERGSKHFRVHTKVVLLVTSILLALGAVLIFAFESTNPETLGNVPVAERILPSFFQSVTSRTAGFFTLPQGSLTAESRLLTCIFMFIGASPAGTGGGIKTTTLALLIAFVGSMIRNKPDTEMFGRRFSQGLVRRAICIPLLAIAVVIAAVFAVSLFERGSGFSMGDMVFEVVSAISTTGLSTGITMSLSGASRILLSVIMYLGRVGLLTVALNIGGVKIMRSTADIQYPVEDMPVG